jgi:hypothetical protein
VGSTGLAALGAERIVASSSVAAVRSWFIRDLLDALERDHQTAVERLPSRLADRLRNHASLEALRTTSPSDAIALADAEEVLLGIDTALGDGSGRILEVGMFELATRTLSQGNAVVLGDLFGTVARLRTAIERPFVDVEVLFELRRTDTGFVLTVGIPGQPRSARILRHLSTGAVRAAQRFSREASSSDFRLFGEAVGDRAQIDARYRQPAPPPQEHTPTSRRPSRSMRVPQQTLSDEVERILSKRPPTDPSPLVGRPRSEPPPRRKSGQLPVTIPRVDPEEEPPKSEGGH